MKSETLKPKSSAFDPRDTECCVCSHDFVDPKILPCGHILCRPCVISCLESSSSSSNDQSDCPLCRRAIVDSEERAARKWDEVVDALPTDFAMEALVASSRALSESRTCGVCDAEASSVCLRCWVLLCASCVRLHRSFLTTRHHPVESLTSVTPMHLLSRRPAFCSGECHDQEEDTGHVLDVGTVSRLFCVDHGVALCTDCAVADHRACPEVRRLEDVAKETDQQLVEMSAKLSAAESELDGALRKVNARSAEVDRSEQAAVAKLNEVFEQLHQLVEKAREDLTSSARAAHDEVRSELAEVKTLLERRRRSVASYKGLLTHVTDLVPCPSLTEAKVRLHESVSAINVSADVQSATTLPSMPRVKVDAAVIKRVQVELEHLGYREEKPKVRVDQMTDNWNYTLRVGVTGTRPAHLSMVYWYEDFDDYFIICHCSLFDHGETVTALPSRRLQ
ncbi:hypothetical protein C0Q70_17757 [Pomacea canaliculata]|uniref:RING-type domain-containing protein n=1 Tax=Pomacea canaliculata TaxID=400727 RepID=A0A2T7NLB1_POMCA|nr:hypothetical protein C0Q70_17757 [Pomacea canaliculata]